MAVTETLLLLQVLHEYADAHLAGGGEEVSRLPARLVERLPHLGVLVTEFAGCDALERVDAHVVDSVFRCRLFTPVEQRRSLESVLWFGSISLLVSLC